MKKPFYYVLVTANKNNTLTVSAFFFLLNRSSSQKILNHCHSKILNTCICKDDENIEYLNLLPYFMNDIVNTLIKHTEENGRGLK